MPTKIETISRSDFLSFAYDETDAFLKEIDDGVAFVVQRFYDPDFVRSFRRFLASFRDSQPASWHPCLDGCPDYHRINDEYEKSWVKGRMHSYFLHRWNAHRERFDHFREIFELKNYLAGEAPDAFYNNVPSDEIISRIVTQHYPRGGGYQAEHIDPTSRFARIQTLVQASEPGKDYFEGGLFVREDDGEPILVDPHTALGDLMVLSPAIRHGVAPVDPGAPLGWDADDGRCTILPIIIRSDYNMDPATKPKAVAS
jgi:hypothetical protein